MKNAILCFFLLGFNFSSCSKVGIDTQTITEEIDTENTVLIKTGMFSPTSGITVNGGAEIRKEKTNSFVALVNFTISSGPDLKVYLSKKDVPSEFVNLGALENGKLSYEIPQGVNIEDYPYVLIHCQQYNHLFAIAAIK